MQEQLYGNAGSRLECVYMYPDKGAISFAVWLRDGFKDLSVQLTLRENVVHEHRSKSTTLQK